MNTILITLALFFVGSVLGYLRTQAIKLERFQNNVQPGDIVIVKINSEPTKCAVWGFHIDGRIIVINTQTGDNMLVGVRNIYPCE